MTDPSRTTTSKRRSRADEVVTHSFVRDVPLPERQARWR